MREDQMELSRQTDVLMNVLQATGGIRELEATLNQNLGALVGAKSLHEAIAALSAAANLLLVHLGHATTDWHQIQLEQKRGASQAA
jgi:hypothetical protein